MIRIMSKILLGFVTIIYFVCFIWLIVDLFKLLRVVIKEKKEKWKIKREQKKKEKAEKEDAEKVKEFYNKNENALI